MSSAASIRSWWPRWAAFAAVALFLGLVARYYHPVYRFTALIQLDGASDPYKTRVFHELPVYVHRDTGGYDGLYYAQIAYNPTLDSKELPHAIDNFSYRARRMLPGTVAYLLAGGKKEWIVHVYSVLNIAAWLTLAWALWRLLAVADGRGWLAWMGVMFSAGALASVRLALTDLIALLFIALGLLAVERAKNGRAIAAIAAAALSRETAVLGLAGLVERPWFSWRNVLRGLGAAAPLAAWLVYVRWQVGPMNQGWANLTLPVMGFVEKWVESLYSFTWVNDQLLVWTNILTTLGLTTQALYFLTRWRLDDRWWRLGAMYTVLLLCLGTAVWEDYPGAAPRVLLPLTLAFNVLAHRSRATLVWLILGNLTIASGLVAFRDPPAHPRELASLSSGPHAAIASVQNGWFGREQDTKRTWNWTRERGTVRIETWPQTPARVQLEFSLRALTPRTVIVRQEGRELYRAEVTEKFSEHRIVVPIDKGKTMLDFSSDRPGTRESDTPGARELAFGLFNPRLSEPQP